MNFLDQLSVWLRSSLADVDTDKIRGYAFNLVENGGDYSVELIGAAIFDEDDPDWACEEEIEATPRSIPVPEPIHKGSWESCLANMQSILTDFLSFGDASAQILKSADGVAIGFVDGDLEVIHKAEQGADAKPDNVTS